MANPNVQALVEEAENLGREVVNAAEKKFGITPQLADAAIKTTEDALPSVEDLMSYIKNLKAEIDALKTTSTKSNTADPETAGGPPVPHHVHLADGRIVTNHDGVGTHYSETVDGVDKTTRIVGVYPVSE